jgi:putative ABC transport system permease protein
MLLKKLLRTLWRYKAQFISMIIMVALGVGVFLGFNVEWYSLEVNTGEIYKATGFADFRIYSDKGFTAEDLEAVKAIDGVEDATRFLSMDVSVQGDTDTLALAVSENMKTTAPAATATPADAHANRTLPPLLTRFFSIVNPSLVTFHSSLFILHPYTFR